MSLSTRLNRVLLSSVALGILGVVLFLMLLFTLVAHAHLGAAPMLRTAPRVVCGGLPLPC